MEQSGKTLSWPEEDFLEATADPNVSMAVVEEEVPSLTVATIVGVTVMMLVAIVLIFLLGVFVDCRQQRIIEKKMGEVKRMKKNQRRVKTHPEDDSASIANNIEEIGMSMPPTEIIRSIP